MGRRESKQPNTGPPRVRRPLSASRFHEGSMNDRTSAAPPPRFLGPEERAKLEKPLRPMSDDWADKQVKKGRLLGQVWEGMRGRLRFRREGGGGERGKSSSSGSSSGASIGASSGKEERMGREEVLASYQQLVASGFFSSTAIQSARQPGPGTEEKLERVEVRRERERQREREREEKTATPTAKASSSQLRPTKEEVLDNYHHLVSSGFFSSHATYGTRPQSQSGTPTPSTPCKPARCSHPAPAASASASRSPSKSPTKSAPPTRPSHETLLRPRLTRSTTPSSSLRSPTASISSRGTKRAAAIDVLSDDPDRENDPPTPKKKLRKSASRDISLPKLRRAASGRAMLSRRSASGPNSAAPKDHAAAATATATATTTAAGGLAKRVLGRLPGGGRGSGEVTQPVPEDGPAPSPNIRRCASGQGVEARKERVKEAHTRILRSRKSANEGLCVVPDAQRGIPSVPAIPSKFTYGEDRENDGPWRGLRR